MSAEHPSLGPLTPDDMAMLMRLPAGKAGEYIREKYDPYFGRAACDEDGIPLPMKTWRVKVSRPCTASEYAFVNVEAADEDGALDAAAEKACLEAHTLNWELDDFSWDDGAINDIEPVEAREVKEQAQ